MSEIIIKFEPTDFKVIKENDKFLKFMREEIQNSFQIPSKLLEIPKRKPKEKDQK